MPTLLAVDLGLRAGLALYGSDGRLQWYRSQNYGTMARFKRAAYGLMQELPDLAWVVVEGGGTTARPWVKEAERRGLGVHQLQAGKWRRALLHARERRSGADAKQNADTLARRVITWSGAPAPTALRHDAAEAILIGLWGVLTVGWLDAVPAALRG